MIASSVIAEFVATLPLSLIAVKVVIAQQSFFRIIIINDQTQVVSLPVFDMSITTMNIPVILQVADALAFLAHPSHLHQ